MADIFELFKKISTPATPAPKVTHLVVGLGNPGETYDRTRHNIGFMALERIAERAGVRIQRSRFRALTAEAAVGGVGALLMKPQTYMNLSGEAVREAAQFYKIPAENIIVLCDDISFDVGQMRIRRRGSAGGHNGLKSIIAELGGDGFPRIRMGVGQKPHPDYDLADWVLGKFSAEDIKVLNGFFDDAASAVEMLLRGEADAAMNRFHTAAKKKSGANEAPASQTER